MEEDEEDMEKKDSCTKVSPLYSSPRRRRVSGRARRWIGLEMERAAGGACGARYCYSHGLRLGLSCTRSLARLQAW